MIMCLQNLVLISPGVQFEGDLGEILALGAEISQGEVGVSLKKKKKKKIFFFKFSFYQSCQHTIDKL